jgi:hypothetical protein
VKASDLSKLLRQAASLLDLYEGKELEFVLDDLAKLKSEAPKQSRRERTRKNETPDEERVRLEELALWARKADLPEVEKVLTSDVLFSSSDNMRAFAHQLGLDLGKRQSIDASIQTILSYLDRARLHRVISRRNSPTMDSEESASPPSDQGTETPSEDNNPKGSR